MRIRGAVETGTAAADRYCEFKACSERFCDHRLNEEYKTLLDDLDNITPDARECAPRSAESEGAPRQRNVATPH